MNYDIMEWRTYTVDVGYDDDNGIVEWVNINDGGVPIGDDKVFFEAIEHYKWDIRHKDD